MQFSDRDKALLETLYPPFRDLVVLFLSRCWGSGINVHLTQGLRTIAEQDSLFYQRVGPFRVSNSRGGFSFHNYGLAVDIGFDGDESKPGLQAPYNEPIVNAWAKCANIGFKCGLQPGYYWSSFKDRPHYQARIKTKIEDLYEILKKSTLNDVWLYLDENEKEAFLLPGKDEIICEE